jgi:hypothetical protein
VTAYDAHRYEAQFEHLPFGSVVPLKGEGAPHHLVTEPVIRNAAPDMTITGLMNKVQVQCFRTDPPGLCRYCWKFSGTCYESFELHDFPFDVRWPVTLTRRFVSIAHFGPVCSIRSRI